MKHPVVLALSGLLVSACSTYTPIEMAVASGCQFTQDHSEIDEWRHGQVTDSGFTCEEGRLSGEGILNFIDDRGTLRRTTAGSMRRGLYDGVHSFGWVRSAIFEDNIVFRGNRRYAMGIPQRQNESHGQSGGYTYRGGQISGNVSSCNERGCSLSNPYGSFMPEEIGLDTDLGEAWNTRVAQMTGPSVASVLLSPQGLATMAGGASAAAGMMRSNAAAGAMHHLSGNLAMAAAVSSGNASPEQLLMMSAASQARAAALLRPSSPATPTPQRTASAQQSPGQRSTPGVVPLHPGVQSSPVHQAVAGAPAMRPGVPSQPAVPPTLATPVRAAAIPVPAPVRFTHRLNSSGASHNVVVYNQGASQISCQVNLSYSRFSGERSFTESHSGMITVSPGGSNYTGITGTTGIGGSFVTPTNYTVSCR